MTYDTWREAVDEINRVTGKVTPKQIALATVARINIPKTLPRLVANARLQMAIEREVGVNSEIPCTFTQEEIISELETRSHKARPKPTDRREAEAWINHLRLIARARALEKLKVTVGDVVEVSRFSETRLAEVSSIGSDGRLYFRGWLGGKAWPDNVTMRVRLGDESGRAKQIRQQVANEAAHRARVEAWSMAKQDELEDFAIKDTLTEATIDQLEAVINGAADEKPIQKFIESHPQVLATLLGGSHARFVVPQKSLAGKYIADFFVGDVDSRGIRWVLVELETPISPIALKNQNDFDANARKGVSQIKEWREWLQNNLDIARRSKRLDGLGLIDIRPRSEGLVLVGRRSLLKGNNQSIRYVLQETNNIRMHTYDWLLERLRGALSFAGPSGLNPHLLQRESETDTMPPPIL